MCFEKGFILSLPRAGYGTSHCTCKRLHWAHENQIVPESLWVGCDLLTDVLCNRLLRDWDAKQLEQGGIDLRLARNLMDIQSL